MELVVLGTGAAYPGPHQACSGYLIKEGATNLLLDCGNGIVSRLQEAGELQSITALLFSHLHADHCLDIFSLFHSRVYSMGIPFPALPLYLPPGETGRFARLAEVMGVEPQRMLAGTFQVSEYDPAVGLQVGDLRLAFLRTVHPVPAFAVRVEGARASLVYSSDTGPLPQMAKLASRCNLLLSEATLSDADFDPARAIHLTPRLAAGLAAKSAAGRLLLTHIWPGLDRQAALKQARDIFPASELAEELKRYPV